MKTALKLTCATLAFGCVGIAPQMAFAQSEAPGADESVQDEIIVTARRVAESLQDVPISLSVVGSAEVEERNNTRVSELVATIPNVTFTSGVLPTITVRGITSQARVNPGFDSGVGVYIDGVVQGKLFAFDQPLYDIDRVEFLRGPQGTLFGKNSVAGAISMTTRNPEFTASGKVDVEYGSFDKRELTAWATTPLSDTLAVSAGGFITKRDGYVTNNFDGRKVANDDGWGARAKILWKPTENAQFVVSGDVMKDDILSYNSEIVSGYGGPSGRYRTNVNLPTLAYRKLKGISLTADIDTSFGGRISSITAYRTAESRRTNDTDAGPLAVVDSASRSKQKQFSQELRLSGEIGDRLNYIVGLYYFRQTTDNFSSSTFGAIPNVPGFLRGRTGNTFGAIDTDSMAIFGSVDWKLTDRLTLTAGLRYTIDDKDLRYQQIGFPFIAPTLPVQPDGISAKDLSPTLNIRYEASDDLMLYATASRGFKSGGWNVDNITDPAITNFKQLRFLDESIWNYEGGIKSQFLDRKITFNLSAFYQKYSDIQTPQLTPVLGGGGALVAIVTNAASADIKGFEAELTAKPVDILTLNGSLGYTKATYSRYIDGVNDFSGNRLPNAPDWTANLSATLRAPVSDGWSIGARGEYSYAAGFFGDRENTAVRRTPSFSTINASAGIYGKNFDLEGFVNNLTDSQDIIFRSGGGFGFAGVGFNDLATRRLGRTFGIRLSGRF
ncbi:MAG: TonB-dependent receptor [Sphingomonadales bacterium]|jgi:iron complex outermembrane receptor protein